MTIRPPLDEITDLIVCGCQIIRCTSELQETITRVLRCAESFFHSSDNEHKLSYRTEEGEGYRPFASEYTDSPDQPDLVECFSCSLTRSSVKSRLPEGQGLQLYDSLLKAHQVFADFSENITRELFRALGVELPPPSCRFGFLEWSRLQINYGVIERAARELLHVKHEDGNFLSIAFATAPGLELITANGKIYDLWRADNDYVAVIAGEILTSVTSGRVSTGFHQVRRRSDTRERLALLYFADCDPESLRGLNASVSTDYIYERITQGWLRSGVAPVQIRDRHREDKDREQK